MEKVFLEFVLNLRDSLVLPFVFLLVATGLYLTVKLRIFQVPNLFLGVKILSGNLDQKKAKGKITHAEAFAAGSGWMGAVVGAFLAREIAGPGALVWIWIVMFPAMAIQFAAPALSIRFRATAASGRVQSGPAMYIEKALRARWLTLLYAGLFFTAVLVAGGLWPLALVYAAARAVLPMPGPGLAVFLALPLILIALGGIRRTGLWAKYLCVVGFVFFACATALYFYFGWTMATETIPHAHPGPTGPIILDFFAAALRGFWPHSLEEAGHLLLGVGCFFALTENGTGKNATIAGTVRTDYPAKQGLVSTLAPFIESALVMTLTMFALYFAGDEGVPEFLTHGSILSLSVLLLIALVCFTIASMSGWLYAGMEVARTSVGRRTGQALPIVYLLLLVVTGAALGAGAIHVETILWGAISANFAAALIPIVALFLLGGPARQELRRYVEEQHARYAFARDLYLLLWTVLPKNLLSRLFGWIAFLRLPRFMMVPILSAFARAYKINLDEAELELSDYPSLNKFFTRALRDGARVVDKSEDTVVSPVDGTISRFGVIEVADGRMIQAKGIDYSVEDLLEGDDAYIARFLGGRFIVLYLSPQDYHRIHSPAYGRILGYTYSPGTLFSVNAVAVQGLTGLFPKNERLTSYLQTEHGLVAIVKVGATNVGKISVTYDTIRTNRWIRLPKRHSYQEEKFIGRGEEIGRFEMGSTVILLFERDMMEFSGELANEQKVLFGQAIGRYFR